MSGKAVGHGGPVFWARVSEGRMGQGGTLFHKGVTTRGPPGHPGSPRSPGTYRSTSSGNTCSPGDRGASLFQIINRGTGNNFSFSEKVFFRKKSTGYGVFWEIMRPLFPGVPGRPFPCNMAPGKEKNIAGGTGGQKTGPLFSRVPRGTLSWPKVPRVKK